MDGIAHYIACCDLYLQLADSHSRSPANSVVNFESKILSTGAASGSEGAQTLEQFSWCEKPISVVLGKVLKKLESNNSLITKLEPLGFLWMLRRLDKCHLRITEQFIWKQEKTELIEIPSEQQRKMDIETTVDSF